MIDNVTYALMAGDAYISNRPYSVNQFPVPEDWTKFNHQTLDSGFEAVSFTNGSEIVISFAGTDSKSAGDTAADIGLAMGWGSAQLLQAAAYYMEVKAANRGAEITFTGHSLGGGLAALLGVFFDKKALTFDQAPFFASATERIRDGIKSYLLSLKDQYGQSLYTLANIQAIAPELLSFADSSRDARAGNVRGYYVQGEALTNYPYNGFLRIGSQVSLTHGPTDTKPWDLHSQALLTAFVLNDDFRLVTNKLTDLLEMIFDKKLYSKPTNKGDENFLDRLVRHQVGNAPGVTEADNMLTRFTDDLKKIAQEAGLTMSNSNLSDALTAFAMQMYYDKDNPNSTNKDKALFENTGVTGGLHFDCSNVATNLSAALGYKLYFQKYLSTLPGNETGVITRQISELLDWYIQAGSSSMTATAGTRRAFMLGGNNGDNLTGSSSEDLLYGGAGTDMLASGAGADTLIGGTGNDVLNGGLGHDIYEYTIGDGNDLIIDEDKDGELVVHNSVINKKIIALGNFYKSGTDEWKPQNNSNIKIVGNMLYLPDGNAIEFGTSLQSGDFGINLIDIPDDPTAPNPVYLDVVDNEHVNHQKTPDYGTTANDMIVGGAGNDWVANYSYGGQYGGDDWMVGGAGNDILNSASPNGNDVLEGDTGLDILFGNSGSNKLYCENPGEMEALIAAGETAQSLSDTGDVASGGEGDDFIYGSNAKDGLFGGLGNDLIVGGGGDDFIYSDAHVYGVNVEQSQTVRLEDNYAGFVDWSYTVQGDASGTFVTALHNVYVDQNSYGNLGDDVIYAGTGNDYVDGGYGDDEIYGGADNDIIFGSAGNDFIEGGTGEDILIGDDAVVSGNDYIDGGDGNDYIEGQRGSDELFGGSGDDAVFGNEDDDYLDGEAGNDTLYGNDGNDELFGGDGLDTIYGDEGDDYIDGETGADSLYGGAGNDVVYGGDDNDLIEGDSSDQIGDDYLDGGAGNDIIIGAGGADEIFGGEGDDQLHGDASNVSLANQGDDYIDGAGGDNLLVGYGGNDTLLAAEGNDTIYGDAGDDYIDAGDGKNTIYGGAGSDEIYAGADDDQIDAGSGDDYVDAGDGSNIIVGGEGNNEIYAGAGADQINVGTGNDYIDAGDGINIITSGAGDDVIYTGAGNDQIWGGAGQDEIYGGAGNDQLYDEGGDSRIYGGEGNDRLQTTDGSAYLDGGAGSDTLLGGTGNDTIYGGAENDYLHGNSGSDTYVFSRGDGSDIIQNYAADYAAATDILQFGASINDVIVTKENNDLRIGINETADSMLIWDWFSGSPFQIDQILFSDGTMLNPLRLEGQIANTIYGTTANEHIYGENFSDNIYGYEGNDIIWGYGGNDIFNGGSGNDVLVGSYVQWSRWADWRDLTGDANGNDTYLFGRDYGLDTICDRDALADNIDVILLDSSIQPADLLLRREIGPYMWNTADDLVLSVNDANDNMTVVNWFDENREWQVERIQFADGSIWDEQIIRQMVLQPTEGEDYLIGYDSEDFINGSRGNDYIEGRAGNDIITGGRGDDILYGGAGNDTYYFNLGDGADTIYDNDVEVYVDNNTIIFGSGITPGMIRLKRGSLLIEVGDNGDSIRIPDFNPEDARANPVINTFVFADGTTLTYDELIDKGFDLEGTENDDAMTGTNMVDRINSLEGNDSVSSGAGDDILTGGAGGDDLHGGSGNDTYVFNLGDGVDTIEDISTVAENNMIRFGEGITANDLSFVRNNGYLTINVGTGGDAINLLNFDRDEIAGSLVVRTLQFVDGSQIKLTDLLNRAPVAANPIAPQTAMEDAVFNFTIPENSFVDPDTGDILSYSATLIDGKALPSWLVFDPATRTLSGTPTNDDIGVLLLQVTAADPSGACVSSVFDVTVQPMVNYGTCHTDFIITGNKRDFINALGGADIVYTGEGNDTIYGGDGTDLLCGDGGNDAIYGENDSDMLLGGNGNDILDGGAGRDVMLGGAGNDTYIIDNTGDIITEFYNEGTDTIQSSINYKLDNTVENLILTGTTSINGTGNNLNNRLTGNIADNTLTGNAGNDILDGGGGDDTLAGGKGLDTYLFGRTDGHDAIMETAGVNGDTDTLKLTGDIAATDPVLVKQDNDLYVFVDADNYIKLVNEFRQINYGIERLEVTDGHYITRTDIQTIVDTMSAINNNSGMDVMQKYNAMMDDQQYQNILAQSWQQ